jgi:D-cysteine desulfhydrase
LLLFWQPVTIHVQQNLRLFKKYNAKLVYKKTLWKTVIGYYLLERITHPRAYFIFAGGSNPIGTIGYVNAAFELKDQIKRGEMPEPTMIICALGSGGTLSGLSLGVQLAGLNTNVIGVRVSEAYLGPFPACTPQTVKTLMHKTYKLLKKKSGNIPRISIKAPQILQDYFGDGYGFPTQKGTKAYHMVKDNEKIILDPTYTAKTFAAVLDFCQGQRRNSEPILYWHTFNSVDMSQQTASVDNRNLPKALQKFLKEKLPNNPQFMCFTQFLPQFFNYHRTCIISLQIVSAVLMMAGFN